MCGARRDLFAAGRKQLAALSQHGLTGRAQGSHVPRLEAIGCCRVVCEWPLAVSGRRLQLIGGGLEDRQGRGGEEEAEPRRLAGLGRAERPSHRYLDSSPNPNCGAAAMRWVRALLKNASLAGAPKYIEHFSKFSPSPLSMKQFLDFGT